MNIAFYLMGEKGFEVLSAFIKEYDSAKIYYVVTAKDNNTQENYYQRIIKLCESESIVCMDKSASIPEFKGYKMAIGWRWLIPQNDNLIIFHDSLLPKYRGFAPLVNMLKNGEEHIGVTALYASESYDQGEIIAQKKQKVNYPLRISEAIQLVSKLYVELCLSISEKILSGSQLSSFVQNESDATYSVWLDYKDYFIDWNNSADYIKRFVDAVSYPYDGAKAYLNNEEITINLVEIVRSYPVENDSIGKVVYFVDSFPVVVCGEGFVKIKEANYADGSNVFPLKKFRSRFRRENYDTF